MPDTLLYTPKDLQHIIDSLMVQQGVQNPQQPQETNWTVIIVTLSTMFALAFIIYKYLIYKYANTTETITDINTNNTSYLGYYIYDGNSIKLSDAEIISILNKYSPYYKILNSEMQMRFERRTKDFMKEKIFILPRTETFKEIPVLVSAAAIQLTFGLENFLLPWFQYIQVHSAEYFADDPHALRVLAGHVSNNTITIAWNQFLRGFKEEHDGVNVGLHEMAHALYYQEIVAWKVKQRKFEECFNEVMTEGEEVYELKNKSHILFTDYAFKDLQEFWAESIEIFFERPDEMQKNHPDLFKTLTELLQQNPLNKTAPLFLHEQL